MEQIPPPFAYLFSPAPPLPPPPPSSQPLIPQPLRAQPRFFRVVFTSSSAPSGPNILTSSHTSSFSSLSSSTIISSLREELSILKQKIKEQNDQIIAKNKKRHLLDNEIKRLAEQIQKKDQELSDTQEYKRQYHMIKAQIEQQILHFNNWGQSAQEELSYLRTIQSQFDKLKTANKKKSQEIKKLQAENQLLRNNNLSQTSLSLRPTPTPPPLGFLNTPSPSSSSPSAPGPILPISSSSSTLSVSAPSGAPIPPTSTSSSSLFSSIFTSLPHQ